MDIRGNRLSFYDTFSERDLEADRRRGENDGTLCQPRTDEDRFSHSEWEIISRTRADVADFLQEVQERRSRHEEERDIKQQRVETFNSRRDVLLLEFKAQQEALRRLSGDGSPRFQQARSAYEEARDLLLTKADDLGRPVATYLPSLAYYLIFGLLSLVEVPINLPAIIQVLREAPLVAALLSVVLGIILLFLSHILGRLLRQMKHAKDSGYLTIHLGFTALDVGILCGLIYLVYSLRIRFMGSESSTVFSGDMLDLVQGGQLFLTFNLAIVLVGSFISFAHHDADPEYQALHAQTRRARKAFDKLNQDYEQERQRLQRRFDFRVASTGREVERVQGDVEVARKQLSNLERRKTAVIDRMLHVMRLRLIAYQAANRSARQQAGFDKQPPYFGDKAIDELVEKLRLEFIVAALQK